MTKPPELDMTFAQERDAGEPLLSLMEKQRVLERTIHTLIQIVHKVKHVGKSGASTSWNSCQRTECRNVRAILARTIDVEGLR